MKNALIIIVIILVVGGIVYAFTRPTTPDIHDDNQVVCTMDAKMCPDGSYVGRTGPNCEFAACPTGGTTTNGTSTLNGTTSIQMNL